MKIYGIEFSNINETLKPGETITPVNGKLSSINYKAVDATSPSEITKLINAVEIDWNGAELSYLPALGTRIVNTTGDFCQYS